MSRLYTFYEVHGVGLMVLPSNVEVTKLLVTTSLGSLARNPNESWEAFIVRFCPSRHVNVNNR